MNDKNIYSKNGVVKWYGKRRVLKLYLLKKFKYCYWCKVKCVDYGDITELQKKGKTPNDMATVDHLTTKFFRTKNENVEKVLSCYKCNHDRGILEFEKHK